MISFVKPIRSILSILCIILPIGLVNGRHKCPCDPHHLGADGSFRKAKQILICIHHDINLGPDPHQSQSYYPFFYSTKSLKKDEIKVMFNRMNAIESAASAGCNLYIRFNHTTDLYRSRFECPGFCSPIPLLDIPKIDDTLGSYISKLDDNTSLTCSLTLGTIRRLAVDRQIDARDSLLFTLSVLAITRYNECHEYPVWLEGSIWFPYRRKAKALITYMGSASRLDLMKDQQLVFKDEPIDGDDAVITWMTTETNYPCRRGTTECRVDPEVAEQLKNFSEAERSVRIKTCPRDVPMDYCSGPVQAYLLGYPSSEMINSSLRWYGKTEKDIVGWSCAQRRHLRATAHLLHLFDPQFMIILDDDTFLNWDLLKALMAYLQVEDTPSAPLFVGENWHQILLGGAGYILMRNSLNRLVGNSMPVRNELWYPKRFRVYDEIRNMSSTMSRCRCVEDVPRLGLTQTEEFGISNRLIDLCAIFFSGEHTCYHSDHAMSRCLLHAAGLRYKRLKCGDFAGMCQWTPDGCMDRGHLTCHRWKAALQKDGTVTAIRVNSSYLHESMPGDYSGVFEKNVHRDVFWGMGDHHSKDEGITSVDTVSTAGSGSDSGSGAGMVDSAESSPTEGVASDGASSMDTLGRHIRVHAHRAGRRKPGDREGAPGATDVDTAARVPGGE